MDLQKWKELGMLEGYTDPVLSDIHFTDLPVVQIIILGHLL